jgi:hypothetical protein
MIEKVPVESGMRAALFRLTARRLAIVAGFFSMAVIILLLMNFHDMKQSDPLTSLSSQKLNELVGKHRLNPGDESIKKEIQVLDRRIRQDYVNSLKKARTGVFLLIAGLIVFVLSLKKSLVFSIMPGSGRLSGYIDYSRIALVLFAVLLVILAIVLIFIPV